MAKYTTDVTKQKQATTNIDVNNQDTATRLWQSLSDTYNNQMEESDKAYDKSISQLNNAMLARGMGRSSQAMHEAAHMYDDKNNARNKLGQALIADYQNRLSDLEEKEAERAFTTSEREASQAWQSGENEANRAFQKSERLGQQKFTTNERIATQNYQSEEAQKAREHDTSERLGQQDWQATQNELNREHDTSERLGTQKWQANQNALDREANEARYGTADQTLAYNYVASILAQGGTPSDDLLARAGLSRADANAMKKSTASTGSSKKQTAWEAAGFSSEDEYNRAVANGYSTKAEYDAGMYNALYGNGTGNRYADQIATIVGYGVGAYDKTQDTANAIYNSMFKK